MDLTAQVALPNPHHIHHRHSFSFTHRSTLFAHFCLPGNLFFYSYPHSFFSFMVMIVLFVCHAHQMFDEITMRTLSQKYLLSGLKSYFGAYIVVRIFRSFLSIRLVGCGDLNWWSQVNNYYLACLCWLEHFGSCCDVMVWKYILQWILKCLKKMILG